MRRLTLDYGCLFVVAAGNEGNSEGGYPARAIVTMPAKGNVPRQPGVPGMLVVGTVNIYGFPIEQNSAKKLINAWAPGADVPLFNALKSGTSYGKFYKMLDAALKEVALCCAVLTRSVLFVSFQRPR